MLAELNPWVRFETNTRRFRAWFLTTYLPSRPLIMVHARGLPPCCKPPASSKRGYPLFPNASRQKPSGYWLGGAER